jgi:beta-mannosidase
MTAYRALHDGWTLSGAHVRDLPATVPGCVHTDLLAAGLIEDPFLDENEGKVGWIGRTDWVYETVFEYNPAGDRVDLVCAGLDTVATVTLNDIELGRTANMHRYFRFDTRGALRSGANRLRIRFDSAYAYAEAQRDRLGDRPRAYAEPYNFIRKMACNFGWDWGPTLVTAGICQDVGLHTWSGARLAEVRPQVTVEGRVGRVDVYVTLDRDREGPVTVTAAIAGREAVTQVTGREAVLTVTVENPELWWPRGYGDQPRYDLDLRLSDSDGTLDVWSRRVGFRTVRLDTGDSAFTVVVNGVPIFVRGVNWIPDDVFVSRVTRARLAERLTQACDAKVNYVRVWGGGRYESEDFYDLADGLGLMVGQDFPFACAAYPEEEPFATEVAAEARENVVRLSPHPSLVLWTGNNENLWGHDDWGWTEPLAGRTWGAGFYFELLPRIVSDMDGTRPYWPGSPYSGSRELPANDPAHGTTHIWDVWNTDDYVKYRAYRPRFAAEFGFQGPPAYATLRRALSDDPLAHDSPGMVHHQKAVGGDAKLQRGLDNHLPLPRDFDEWHYLTQLNQARAVAYGIEHFRSLRPLCMGTIVWQLNDCWPVTSWSAVDSDGRRKPLWYALRRAYADRLLTLQPRDGAPALVAVNDSATPWTLSAVVARHTLTGRILAETTLTATVEPGTAAALPLPTEVAVASDPAAELVVATERGIAAEREVAERVVADASEHRRAWWFFAEDKDIAWPPATFDTRVEPGLGVTRVTVTARSILRDLTLQPDRIDPAAEVDESGVTVLPGERVTFTVTGRPDPAALTRPPVLRCVNSA